MALRDELAHIELYARRIKSRELIEQAVVLQMRTERRLGQLLRLAKEAGQISQGRRKEDGDERVTLAEIGVDKKLSMTAQRAAALDDDAFETVIESACERMRSGRAILVDPIQQAEKSAELDLRRRAHADRTREGCTVEDLGELALSGYRARFIGMDPQWQFLTRSAAGEGRSANVHYKTEAVDRIKQIPVGDLAADDCMLGMWMVDWAPADALQLIAHYGFTHITTLYTWIKTNGEASEIWDASSWHLGMGYWTRANPEDCWLATKGSPKRLYMDVRQLIIAPVMEHSRKPDAWLERTERLVEGPYLELNARRRRPGWTAWGDELEWQGPAEQTKGVAA